MQLELEAANAEVDKVRLLQELVEAWESVLPELERQKNLQQ
jgi:hypothetical protein